MSDLRQKAEKATRGEWFWDTANSVCSLRSKQNGGRIVVDIAYGGTQPSTVNIQNANATYIAAAHPQAIIALLDERDALAARVEAAEAELARIAAGCITGEGTFEETAPPEVMRISRKLTIERARKYFGNITQQEAKAMADKADWRSIRERLTARQALGDHNDG